MIPKHHNLILLIFIVNCISKCSLIRILKRENQLHLFRRLEQCSSKQIKCDGAIEFLRLCQNLDLTPTFAKVDETKSNKWQHSSKVFTTNVIAEEISSKAKQNATLKKEINAVYDEIRQTCSPLRYVLILRIMTDLRKKLYDEVMAGHTSKIARLLNKDLDVDKHILNLSSYQLSVFQKLVLCRGFKFSLPQPVSACEVKASFEKAYWRLEPSLPEEKKELTATTLRSIALNYIGRKGPKPPKALQRAINQLRQRDDIVITKPDKGSGVVVMDKTEYIRLLNDASINDTSKFISVSKKDHVREADLPNTTIHFCKKKNISNLSSGKSYQSRSLTQSVVKAPAWPIFMASRRLTSSSYQCDRFYPRQGPTTTPWLSGLMTNSSHYQ